MAVNADKPQHWDANIAASVGMYNDWFKQSAPAAYQRARREAVLQVKTTLTATNDLTNISPELLYHNPTALPIFRAITAPPIALERLAGFAGVPKQFLQTMEGKEDEPGRMPPRTSKDTALEMLNRVGKVIEHYADREIFSWLYSGNPPKPTDIELASILIAERLCSNRVGSIIRNDQEERQLSILADWLGKRGYREIAFRTLTGLPAMPPGTFMRHVPVHCQNKKDATKVKIVSVDAVIKPTTASITDLPIMLEAKSAGDFTNVNKRQKEEADKIEYLRKSYDNVHYVLLLCGYFGTQYLTDEASAGIDWVWEHRLDDLAGFGL